VAEDLRPRARELVAGARGAIEANRRRIDDLNVYPVPDGDTGTNLTLTVKAVEDALRADGPGDRASLAKEAARAALLGARGNSGVILSQIVRGAADALAGTDDVARVLRSASDAGYDAVREPVEGTILTVIRSLAEAAEGGADLRAIVARGDEAVLETREQLPLLRDAGVVDAGGAGLMELVRGVVAVLTGERLPEPAEQAEAIGIDAIHQELSRYRYCTLFVVEGDDLDREELERELAQLGDSVLVVGDRSALKAHVHTDDPGRALSLAVARGAIDGVEIANMHAQTVEREQRLLRPRESPDEATSVVAVSIGAGNRALFESLGAIVVDCKASMTPATADLMAAIEAAPAPVVVVLPNNDNAIMSAEQAASNAEKDVQVLPTRSIPAGLAALVAFDAAAGIDENLAAMGEVLSGVATGAVTVASRDVALNGLAVRAGAWLGLREGEPVAGGDTFDEVAKAVVERLLEEPRGVLTLLAGESAPELDGVLAYLEREHPELELDVHQGGQPHYPLLLSAE
jgi:DAK2 domain fusion protein YloV